MKCDLVEVVFILDKSGSMSGLENDTIGGYNAMLQKQKDGSGEVIVTTVLFDDEYVLLHDRINIRGVKPITQKEYFVGGCTALLDAIGQTIHKIANVQQNTSDEKQAGKVLFVITTDGQENASKEYTFESIKKLVESHKKNDSWEFIFLGANIDAIATASKIGIGKNRSTNFFSDVAGTRMNYKAMSDVLSSLRADKDIEDDWNADIAQYYHLRHKQNKHV